MGRVLPFHERPPERLMADQYGKEAKSKFVGYGTDGIRGEHPGRKELLKPRRYASLNSN